MNAAIRAVALTLASVPCVRVAYAQDLTTPGPAPQTAPATVPPTASQPLAQPPHAGDTSVAGVIQDNNGTPITGASLVLIPAGRFGEKTATTDPDGSFSFGDVAPGLYHLSVTATGLDPYTSPEFVVHAATPLTLPHIPLRISTSTSISVVANDEQIALAQIQQQETQRVFGVFQNFYTSYIWDAKPMPAKQKYRLAFRSLIDPPQFLIVAGVAGAEHYNGTYPGYGPGIEGYGKRYGAALADQVTGRLIGSAILPSLLHQDPRYFYQGSGSVPSRTFHAVSHTFTARGDNGHIQPNYSHLLGTLAAAGIANLYHPETSRGVGDTFQNFGINTAGNIVGNLVREFVLRHLETIPSFANGKQPGEKQQP